MPARPRSPTVALLRGELRGFARSRVMLALWVLMPAIAIVGYLVLPATTPLGVGRGLALPATMYMSLITGMLGGSIAAVMVAVDIVSERSRRVYELLVIRPIRRDAIIWAKFIAVLACVAVACALAVALGVALDALRGHPPTAAGLASLGRSLATLAGVLAISTGGGVLIGVLARTSIVAAVILVLQVSQNLAVVPLLPGAFGILPDRFWIVMALSLGLALLLVYAAARVFGRAEL